MRSSASQTGKENNDKVMLLCSVECEHVWSPYIMSLLGFAPVSCSKLLSQKSPSQHFVTFPLLPMQNPDAQGILWHLDALSFAFSLLNSSWQTRFTWLWLNLETKTTRLDLGKVLVRLGFKWDANFRVLGETCVCDAPLIHLLLLDETRHVTKLW